MAVPMLACSQQDVVQSQSYSCESEVLRTNSVVLDSRHRKDQLDLNRHEQSSYRKLTCVKPQQFVRTTSHWHSPAPLRGDGPQHCAVYQCRCRERGQVKQLKFPVEGYSNQLFIAYLLPCKTEVIKIIAQLILYFKWILR